MEDNGIHTKFFSLKVLTCIYDLQVGGDNMSVAGITIDEIVEQMCRRFVTDGDVEAQVLISLKQICHKGLVGRIKDRYKLVGPMARILLMTHRNCERRRQIEKIQRIFFNNCVANTMTNLPSFRSLSQSQINDRSHKRSRSRTKEFDVLERPKRSKTKEIETRKNSKHSKQSTRRSRTTTIRSSKESHTAETVIVRDLVDFLQYDSSSTTTNLSSFSKQTHHDIITLLPENKNYKCYQSECICSNDGCIKSNNSGFFQTNK